VYTHSFVDRLGDVKVDDVQVRDGLRQLTQQEDDDDDDQHHLQLQFSSIFDVTVTIYKVYYTKK